MATEAPRPLSHHCDEAIAEIDAMLVEDHEVTRVTILNGLAQAVYRGELTELEAKADMDAYDAGFSGGDSH